jgi:hypothetical protein
MTAIVTKTNIHTAAFSNIYDTLNNRYYVQDPRTGTANTRVFLHDADPLHKSIGFTGLPYIVVGMPTVEYSNESLDSLHKFVKWKQELIIRTARDGASGSQADVGRTDMNNILDQIHTTFNSSNVKTNLSNWNMKKVKAETVDSDTLIVDEKYVFESKVDVSYMVRMTTG